MPTVESTVLTGVWHSGACDSCGQLFIVPGNVWPYKGRRPEQVTEYAKSFGWDDLDSDGTILFCPECRDQ